MNGTTALRECLADCQLNRGLDPLLCQDECRHLTPGDPCYSAGCCEFWGCFAQETIEDVQRIPAAASGVLRWTGETIAGAVTPLLQAAELPLATLAVVLVGGIVLYVTLRR